MEREGKKSAVACEEPETIKIQNFRKKFFLKKWDVVEREHT